MCKLAENFKELDISEYVGYKVAIKIDNKYYSPVTGIEYKVGPVEIPETSKPLCSGFVDVLNKNSIAYEESMIGRTCVLTDYNSATKFKYNTECFKYPGNLVILRFGVCKDLMIGFYNNCLVVGGKEILFMREI